MRKFAVPQTARNNTEADFNNERLMERAARVAFAKLPLAAQPRRFLAEPFGILPPNVTENMQELIGDQMRKFVDPPPRVEGQRQQPQGQQRAASAPGDERADIDSDILIELGCVDDPLKAIIRRLGWPGDRTTTSRIVARRKLAESRVAGGIAQPRPTPDRPFCARFWLRFCGTLAEICFQNPQSAGIASALSPEKQALLAAVKAQLAGKLRN